MRRWSSASEIIARSLVAAESFYGVAGDGASACLVIRGARSKPLPHIVRLIHALPWGNQVDSKTSSTTHLTDAQRIDCMHRALQR